MRVEFEPIGRRVEIQKGTTLLEASQQAGIDLLAICGGGGTCGTCQVRLISGQLTPLSADEEMMLTPEEFNTGLRLACQSQPLTDVRIDIPPQSLTTPQRTQIEGLEVDIELDPVVIPIDVQIDPATNYDLRSDVGRLRDALARQGIGQIAIAYPVLQDISDRLRERSWSVRCAIERSPDTHHHRIVALLPVNTPLLGFAVDVGTTKLAGYLVDLGNGKTIGKLGAMNPQIAYGEDVVARIAYSNQKTDGRLILQHRLIATLNDMLEELCGQAKVKQDQVVAAVIVGNTVMHHLFCGLPVRQLGAAPYVAAENAALEISAGSVGLNISPAANIYLPPNIAGYVGADHVAMLLATDAWRASGNALAIDIGTNTEITLAAQGELFACSCASGPAFEGAHIYQGMRAAPGAIERVQIRDGKVFVHTIGNLPPVGLCGSGILDAVAEMVGSGILDLRGALNKTHAGVRPGSRVAEYLLVPSGRGGNDQDIVVTREDVNQIQLAKAAIRAGIEILLKEAKLSAQDIDQFMIAGAFGTYIDLGNAVKIGMFPRLPLDRFIQVGNAAGTGARQLLVSRQKRKDADQLASLEHYIELTTYPDFTNMYVDAMYFQ